MIPNNDVYDLPVAGIDGGEVALYRASFREKRKRSLKFAHKHPDCWIQMEE